VLTKLDKICNDIKDIKELSTYYAEHADTAKRLLEPKAGIRQLVVVTNCIDLKISLDKYPDLTKIAEDLCRYVLECDEPMQLLLEKRLKELMESLNG